MTPAEHAVINVIKKQSSPGQLGKIRPFKGPQLLSQKLQGDHEDVSVWDTGRSYGRGHRGNEHGPREACGHKETLQGLRAVKPVITLDVWELIEVEGFFTDRFSRFTVRHKGQNETWLDESLTFVKPYSTNRQRESFPFSLLWIRSRGKGINSWTETGEKTHKMNRERRHRWGQSDTNRGGKINLQNRKTGKVCAFIAPKVSDLQPGGFLPHF